MPNCFMFEWMLATVYGVHSSVSAISFGVSDVLFIISSMNFSFHGGRFGAILSVREETVHLAGRKSHVTL